MAFLIVLGPLIIEAVRRHIPLVVETNAHFLNVTRYGITIAAMKYRNTSAMITEARPAYIVT